MVDTVRTWRGTTSDFNESTRVESPISGTQLYLGKARIRPTRGPREQPIADGVLTMRDADILLPIDAPQHQVDDEIYVESSQDQTLQGTWFRVTDARSFSQQGAMKLSAIQSQPSRLWPNLAVDDG